MEKEETVKPNISMPKSLLNRLDKEADRYKLTRSGFIRLLIVKYLEGGVIILSTKEDHILAKLKRAERVGDQSV